MWILFLFLFAGMVQGAELSQDVKPEIVSDFSGGLNTSAQSFKIANNFSPNMRNVYIDEKDGSVVAGKGYGTLGVSTPTLTKISFQFPFYNENGAKEFLISDSSIVLTTKDFITYTLIRTGLNTATALSAVQFRNKVWLSNGSDSVFSWDGSTMILLNGNSGTPDIPKCKYLAVYQDRIFGFNRDTNNSELDWSLAVDTNGTGIAPDNALAWPAANNLKIGQGDGTVGTAIWTFSGQLCLGKESSIFVVYGADDTSYFARKIDPLIGPSVNSSVQVLDGYTYFLSKEGIYRWSGGLAERISDKIREDVLAISANSSNIVSNLWETKTQFDIGQYYNTTSTVLNPGYLTVETSVSLNSFSVPPIVGQYQLTILSTNTEWTTFPTNSLPLNYSGNLSSVTIVARGATSAITTATIKFMTANTISGTTEDLVFHPKQNNEFISFSSFGITILGTEVRDGTFKYKIEWDTSSITASEPTSILYISSLTASGQAIVAVTTNTAQFVSEVATMSTLNFWDSFLTIQQTNGGTINYFNRSCSSANCVSTTAWTQVSAGTLIGLSTASRYYQWAATMTSVNRDLPPTIDRVEVRHNEGTAVSIAPKSVIWQNRYWLLVSTDSTATNFIVYVKALASNANPNAWMLFDNMNFTSIGVFNDQLYAGSSSAGQVFRLDNGTNYNGSAINFVYDTPDLILGSNFTQKNFKEYWIDTQKETDGILNVGSSVDGGNFSFIPISLNGSGRLLRIIHNMPNPAFGKTLRLRFQSNVLDKGFTLNNVIIMYQPTVIRD